jgi:hypothetical protein
MQSINLKFGQDKGRRAIGKDGFKREFAQTLNQLLIGFAAIVLNYTTRVSLARHARQRHA